MERTNSSLLIFALIFCVLPREEEKPSKTETEPEETKSFWPEEIFGDDEYREMVEVFPRT